MKTIKFSYSENNTENDKIDNSDKKIRVSSSFNFKSLNCEQYNNDVFSYNEQLSMITKLYSAENFIKSNEVSSDIKKKISSYMQQDKLKKLYDTTNFITFPQVIEKLVISKLKCYYCNNSVNVIYKYQRSPYQWTLDRIMNDQGHNFNNTVVCCLKCNLSRRCLNSDKFLFTKNLHIIKS